MARSRAEFDTILRSLLPEGLGRTYFQPEQNVSMVYPAIVYERNVSRTQFADNIPYSNANRYTVTVIDEDPDSGIPHKVAALPMTKHNRFFVSGKLNHDVYDVYF